MTKNGLVFEVKKMLRNWSLRIAAWVIIGCFLFSAAVTRPAGAMIFPELLSLVRVENQETVSGDETKEELYVVKAGDTLWNLSRKYGVDWKTIAYANNLSLNGVIHAGQTLTIPIGEIQYHIVKRGESLWQIARKYKKDMKLLASANNIVNVDCLRVGTRLVIPQEEKEDAVPAYARQNLPSRYKGYWRWPVKGEITSTYGPRGSEFHHGLDIAAEKGERIYPVRAGEVEFSGWLNSIYGRAVIVDHGDGIRTVYAHNSKNLVEEGDRVRISQPIAEIGSTGKSTGPHLHLEVHVDNETIDPLRLLEQ
jgi:murein DD-endopeptidase MepM/ murein hydrolase activator NlpD